MGANGNVPRTYAHRWPRSPPARCRRKKLIVETLNNVAHDYAYRIKRLSRLCGVCYMVRRVHEGGGLPVTRAAVRHAHKTARW